MYKETNGEYTGVRFKGISAFQREKLKKVKYFQNLDTAGKKSRNRNVLNEPRVLKLLRVKTK